MVHWQVKPSYLFQLSIGRVNCSCYSRYCQRSFVVSNVPKTNLYLVIVDGLCTAFGNTKDVPGEPQEYILCLRTFFFIIRISLPFSFQFTCFSFAIMKIGQVLET